MRRAYPPLPIRPDWTPSYLRARGDENRDYAFDYKDPQGAPSYDGFRYHSAVDWFAPGDWPVRSPASGKVHRVSPSRGNTGQVFGGVVEILEPNGTTWVMRHVNPVCSVGQKVGAGNTVAEVTPWRDGGPHLHLEIWKTPTGGYRHENMIDPREVEWTSAVVLERPEPKPLPHGTTLRLQVHGHPGPSRDGKNRTYWAGWDECKGPLRSIAVKPLQPVPPLAKGDHWIAWNHGTWFGAKDVTNVSIHLVKKFLDSKEYA